jgi:structural maintenance of chromosome 1
LVFQGDIENLASKTPKELTRLFEQISGSEELRDEYDRLKLALEKAMQESTEAFTKKKTISVEWKTAKEHKNELSRFDELNEQKDELFRDQMLIKLKQLEQQENEARSIIAEGQEKGESLAAAVQDAERQSKVCKKAHGQTTLDSLKMEKRLKKEEKKASEMRDKIGILKENLDGLSEKVKTLQEAINGNRREYDLKQQEIKAMALELDKIIRAEEAFQVECAIREKIALSDEQLRQFRELKESIRLKVFEKQQEADALQIKLSPMESEASQVQDERLKVLSAQKRLKDEEASLTEKLQKLQMQGSAASAELAILEKDIEEIGREKKALMQQESEASGELRDVLQQLLTAKVEQQESDRLRRQATVLSELQQLFPNGAVRGKVIDLCTPIHKKYQIALGFVLGRHLESIVVEKEQVAIACIQYLREQRAPPMTFLPMDTIKSKALDDALLRACNGDAVQLAMDVLKVDSDLKGIFSFVTGILQIYF